MGDTVLASENADIKPGNALPVSKIPVGTLIHNVEIKPGRGGQMVRSAGAYAQLMAKEGALRAGPSAFQRSAYGSHGRLCHHRHRGQH